MIQEEIIEKILDLKGGEKNLEWAEKMVSLIMRNSVEIISKANYELGKNILYGKFPEIEFNKIFVGEQMNSLRQKLSKENTLYFFERIRNTLIDQRNQAGLSVTVNSLDPTKEEKKKFDRDLLKNRKGLEGLMNTITANNGMPPKKVEPEDFNGNVADFDAKSGDEFDTTELDTFFGLAWGLMDEIYAQNALNMIYAVNEVRGEYDKYINDILICLCNFSQVYVDEVEGSIKHKHLYPYEVRVLHATGANNFKDAQGFCLPRSTNIRTFIRLCGSEFNFERDWQYLLQSAKGPIFAKDYSGLSEGGVLNKSSGVKEGGGLVFGSRERKIMDFDQFLDLPVTYCYSEWKTQTKKVTQYGVTSEGNIIPMRVNEKNPRVDGAKVDEVFEETTYYAYSLDVTAVTPKIVKWGKVYMQEFDGLQDEYSGFTIKGNKRDGVPIVEIIKPFWNIINVTFKMLELLIADIKPDGLNFNYSSILKIAQHMVAATDTPNDMRKGIELFLQSVQHSPNTITDNPTTPDGDIMGGGSSGVTTKKNGLNETAQDITKVIDWAEGKCSLYTGTAGIEIPNPDDGYKLSVESKIRTRAATSFIDAIMLDHLKDTSITCLNYVLDIAKFSDIPAYKYLESAIGYKAMEYLAKRKKSLHRYGTVIQTFNNDISVMEIRGSAKEALVNQQISYEQYTVLFSFTNPTQAAMYLAYERKRAQKQKELEARAQFAGTDALSQKQHERNMELENLKGEWRMKAEQSNSQGFITAAQINSQAQITSKQIQEQGQNQRLAAEAINDINKIAETQDKQEQAPI